MSFLLILNPSFYFNGYFWQRFTNEDHLSVHKHKHEMTLKFGPARTDSVIIAGNCILFYFFTNLFILN